VEVLDRAEGGAAMPSHVRFFWWLSVAVVAYAVASAAWHLTFPDSRHLAAMARLPEGFRNKVRVANILTAIVPGVIWNGATLGSAWLAAFRRRNWARWVFAAIFVLRQLISLLVFAVVPVAVFHIVPVIIVHDLEAAPLSFAPSVLLFAASIAAIVLVFTGNARDWFEQPPALPGRAIAVR